MKGGRVATERFRTIVGWHRAAGFARRIGLVLPALAIVLALLAVPTRVLAAPAIAVAPSSGPVGTTFLITGTGFPVGVDISLDVVLDNTTLGRLILQAEADGSFGVAYNSAGGRPGDYGVVVFVRNEVTTTGRFTVTGGALPPGPPAGGDEMLNFPETGFSISGPFLNYWRSNGLDFGDTGVSYAESLALFGFPITEERQERLEDGREYRVQYFERARFEYHPENQPPFDVLLGQFGRRIRPADPPVAALPDQTFFAETGHNLGGRFGEFWQQNGGLAIFGFPISEEIVERLEDDREYRVQYFERARFEAHPENAAPYDVLLGQFGRRVLTSR